VPGLEPPARDIARAIALVKQSGVPTPIAVNMNVPNTPDRTQLAEVIQSMARDAGFDVKINLFEFASSLSAATQGNFESYLIGWSGRADADGNLYVFLHTGAGQNDGRYSNPIVDEALDTARTLTDPAARRAQYATLMEQERKDLPIIYLFHPVNVVGMSVKLSGFHPVPDGMIRLQGLSVTK
jgi:peptide/nickel transport system substrate-binding protein